MARAAATISIGGDTTRLTADVQKALSRFNNKPINFRVNQRSFTQPLGNITSSVTNFDDALAAANKRVIAFSASAGIILGATRAFSAFVKSAVEVEKSLKDINVILNLSDRNLGKFSRDLFKAAQQTGQAFSVAAEAATEFSRQGLSAEKTIIRVRDALILTRLSGLDATASVDALTAAVNGFARVGLETTEVVNKLATVDAAFAVSSKDLADALSRVGSSAQEAGVSFDQLLGLVTAAQQITARGGAVIGNSLKTIFTRIGRESTLNKLETLGVQIRTIAGDTRPALEILRSLANVYDTLGQAQRQQAAEAVGGVFQINQLKAVLTDLSRDSSIFTQATLTASEATDEAIRRNGLLNSSLAASFQNLATGAKEASATIGELTIAPLLRTLIGGGNSLTNGIISVFGKAGKEGGSELGRSLLEGIGEIIKGPGLALLLRGFAGILVPTLRELTGDLRQTLGKSVIGSRQAKIQKGINVLLNQATDAEKRRFQAAQGVTQQQQILLKILERQLAVSAALGAQRNALAGSFGLLSGRRIAAVGRNSGVIPNFADPLNDAVNRELKSGVKPSDIYIDSDPRIKSSINPAGLLVANKRDEPAGGFQGVNRSLRLGANPKTAGLNSGFVPNFVTPFSLPKSNNGKAFLNQSGRFSSQAERDETSRILRLYQQSLIESAKDNKKQSAILERKFNAEKNFIPIRLNLAKVQDELAKQVKREVLTVKQLNAQRTSNAKAYQKIVASTGGGLIPTPIPKAVFPNNRSGVIPIGATPPISAPRAQTPYRPATPIPVDYLLPPEQVKRLTANREAGKILDIERRQARVNSILARAQEGGDVDRVDRRFLAQSLKRDILSGSEFSGFSEKEIFGKGGPKNLKKLFTTRFREQFKGINAQLVQAAQQAASEQERIDIQRVIGRGSIFRTTAKDAKLLEQAGFNKRDQARQGDIIRQIQSERRGRVGSALLGAAFALPLASAFIPKGTTGQASGIASGALSGGFQGAATGAILGSAFGPAGAGIGGGLGLLFGGIQGALKRSSASLDEFTKRVSESNEQMTIQANAIAQYGQTQELLGEAIGRGDLDAVKRLRERQAQNLAQTNPANRRALVGAGFDQQEILSILSKANEDIRRSTFQQTLVTSTEDFSKDRASVVAGLLTGNAANESKTLDITELRSALGELALANVGGNTLKASGTNFGGVITAKVFDTFVNLDKKLDVRNVREALKNLVAQTELSSEDQAVLVSQLEKIVKNGTDNLKSILDAVEQINNSTVSEEFIKALNVSQVSQSKIKSLLQSADQQRELESIAFGGQTKIDSLRFGAASSFGLVSQSTQTSLAGAEGIRVANEKSAFDFANSIEKLRGSLVSESINKGQSVLDSISQAESLRDFGKIIQDSFSGEQRSKLEKQLNEAEKQTYQNNVLISIAQESAKLDNLTLKAQQQQNILQRGLLSVSGINSVTGAGASARALGGGAQQANALIRQQEALSSIGILETDSSRRFERGLRGESTRENIRRLTSRLLGRNVTDSRSGAEALRSSGGINKVIGERLIKTLDVLSVDLEQARDDLIGSGTPQASLLAAGSLSFEGAALTSGIANVASNTGSIEELTRKLVELAQRREDAIQLANLNRKKEDLDVKIKEGVGNKEENIGERANTILEIERLSQKIDSFVSTDSNKPKILDNFVGTPSNQRYNPFAFDEPEVISGQMEAFNVEGSRLTSGEGSIGDQYRSFKEGFVGSIDEVSDSLKDLVGVGREVGASLQENLSSAFGDFVVGAQNGKDAFRGFVTSVLSDASRAFASQAMQALLGGVLGSNGIFGLGNNQGGPIRRAMGGGVPSLLTGGEMVIGPRAAQRIGGSNLRAINNGSHRKFAGGGMVRGGSGVRDDVPANLAPGSFVIKKSAVQKYGSSYLDAVAKNPRKRFFGGALFGALLGGGIGYATGGKKGALVGAIGGGITGGLAQNFAKTGNLFDTGGGKGGFFGFSNTSNSGSSLSSGPIPEWQVASAPNFNTSSSATSFVGGVEGATSSAVNNTFGSQLQQALAGLGISAGLGLGANLLNGSNSLISDKNIPRFAANMEADQKRMLAEGTADGQSVFLQTNPQGGQSLLGFGYVPATRRFSEGGFVGSDPVSDMPMGGDSTPNVNIEINIDSSGKESEKSNSQDNSFAQNLSRQVKNVVLQELQKQKRVGGMLTK